MAEKKTEDVPIQGKLIDQKLNNNELEIEMMISEIRKCDKDEREIAEFRSKARKSLQGISLDIETLVEMKEQEKNEIKQGLLDTLVTKHKKVMMSLQVNLRKASLFASEKISSLERNELLSLQRRDSSENTAVQRRKKSQEKAANIASNVTSNLVRIAELMNSQVEHSIESARVLEDSSKELQETHEELKGMKGIIQMSKKLINKYSRRELTDTLLIFFGLVLFFSTVIYIILKRI